jgi:hypothetical protein
MKKLLLFMSFSVVAIFSANAQCVPDPAYTNVGIYPDSATGFSSGCVGVQYDQLITNVVPADTCVVVVPGFPCVTVSIDSIKIVSFTGLPAGFTYSCYDAGNSTSPPDQCTYEGGTIGCAAITGMPTAGEVGIHNLVITVDVYAGGQTSPQGTEVIDWYFIEIEDVPTISTDGYTLTSSIPNNNQWHLDGSPISGATGQDHIPLANGTYTVEGNCGMSADFILNDLGIDENLVSNFKLFPNPANEVITVRSNNDVMIDEISVRSLNGHLVYTSAPLSSVQTIDVNRLENGIYFVNVTSSKGTETIRFVKK